MPTFQIYRKKKSEQTQKKRKPTVKTKYTYIYTIQETLSEVFIHSIINISLPSLNFIAQNKCSSKTTKLHSPIETSKGKEVDIILYTYQ
mgnify:FL=1